jgi:CelD/BcsL family acetyltransferase involved in cellulose biosynthesis
VTATIEVGVIREHAALAELSKEWATLHGDAAPGSPFEHPAWVTAWAQYYVPEGQLECVVVRDHSLDGLLIGFAPLYRRYRGVAGLRATCIQPLGTGRNQALTEVVQVLALPGRTAEVIRAVVRHLEAMPDWNWAQVSLGPDQGWLLPQWLDDQNGAMILLAKTRPCVVFEDMPGDAEALRAGLKRNVRESIRRSRNRSAKLGGVTFHCATDVPEIEAAVPKLAQLHRMRSGMPGKVEHSDHLGGIQSAFLAEAVRNLAAYGLARVHLAEHTGQPVAAQLVLSDGHTDYVSISGLNPSYWELSLNTMLIFNVLQEAATLGRTAVNLSTGPSIAKNRWSSKVKTYHDFAIVRTDRRSRWMYGAFAHAGLALTLHEEARFHRIKTGTKSANFLRHTIGEIESGAGPFGRLRAYSAADKSPSSTRPSN